MHAAVLEGLFVLFDSNIKTQCLGVPEVSLVEISDPFGTSAPPAAANAAAVLPLAASSLRFANLPRAWTVSWNSPRRSTTAEKEASASNWYTMSDTAHTSHTLS